MTILCEPDFTGGALRGGSGRPAETIVALAVELRADLLVVGNHQRQDIDRFWHGSVSYGVLSCATHSVACIPRPN